MSTQNGQTSAEIYVQRKQICKLLYEVCIEPVDTFKYDNQFIKIWSSLEQLNQLEKDIPFCCTSTQRSDKSFENFSQFILVENQNVKLKKLGDDQYGVEATHNFDKGDLIFQVTDDKILTLKCKDEIIDHLIDTDRLVNLMPNVAMALLLLKLKTSTTQLALRWEAYLNVLPSQFNTPLYFSLDEIKMLQASHSFLEVLLHIRSAARQYAYLFNLFDSKTNLDSLKNNFSFENYKWAVSVVSTRQNEVIDLESNSPVVAMIPLLEMCNHRDGEMCTEYDVKTQSAKCYADKDIQIGDEVTIFYGKRSDKNMLIHNGFVCETNPYNSLTIKLGISLQDPMFKQRTAVLELFGVNNTEKFEVYEKSTDNVDPFPTALLFFIKIFQVKEMRELLEFYLIKPRDIEIFSKDLKPDLEVKQFLKMRLTILLKAHEQHNLKYNSNFLNNNNDNSICLNRIFIKRLIDSEIGLLKTFISYL